MSTNQPTALTTKKRWSALPRRYPGRTPLEAILGTAVDPEAFRPDHLDALRQHAAASVPALPARELDEFLGEFFSRADVLSIYFRPTRIYVGHDPQYPLRTVLPFDYAVQAAHRASTMPALLPHERGLAWLAAFVYPCGLFHAADPSMKTLACVGRKITRLSLKELRYELVNDALRQLRRSSLALGEALSASLELGGEDQCEPQQLARVLSSVRLGIMEIQRLWQGVCDARE